MNIALVDTVAKPKFYPIALLKIGAWRKSLGDSCRIFNNTLPPKNTVDEIWLTTTFTFDLPHVLGMVRDAKRRAKRVFVGGISATLMPDKFER